MRTSFFSSPVRSLVILAISVGFFIPAHAAVTQLGAPGTATTTNTLAFTVPAGNNRVLIVTAADDNALDIASVTFAGNNLIQRAERSDTVAVDSIWSFTAGSGAAISGTITVVSTGVTPNVVKFIGAVTFQGVEQTNPINNPITNQSLVAPSSSSFNVPSAANNLVFDVFDVYRGPAGATGVTSGGTQTVIHSVGPLSLAPGGFGVYRTSTRPGAAITPMSWTTADGEALLHLAVNIVAAPTAAGATVSGRIATVNGAGIRNVTVVMTDSSGNSRRATTGSFGYYSFGDVPTGATYTVTVVSKRFSFSNPVRVINVGDSITDLDWVAD